MGMDRFFFCPLCRADHKDPADPLLGHRVICLECALDGEFTAYLTEPVAFEHTSAFDSGVAA